MRRAEALESCCRLKGLARRLPSPLFRFGREGEKFAVYVQRDMELSPELVGIESKLRRCFGRE